MLTDLVEAALWAEDGDVAVVAPAAARHGGERAGWGTIGEGDVASAGLGGSGEAHRQ